MIRQVRSFRSFPPRHGRLDHGVAKLIARYTRAEARAVNVAEYGQLVSCTLGVAEEMLFIAGLNAVRTKAAVLARHRSR